MPNGYYHPEEDRYLVEMWHGGHILRMPPWRVHGAAKNMRVALGIGALQECAFCFTDDDVATHMERFPEGQFAGDRRAATFGLCTTMRTSRPPNGSHPSWIEAIGDKRLAGHEPDGHWLFMVQIAVHPRYQRHGMGSAFIRACSALAVHQNLRGIYVVGMLLGYKDHSDKMDVEEYGYKVGLGEIYDPIISLFLKRGFQDVVGEPVIPGYFDVPYAGGAGVLLVWKNHLFDSGRVK